MKNPNKALIAISVLIVASLSTAAVSTLAWFNVNRSVSMNYSSITINGNYGHLKVSIESVSDPYAKVDKSDEHYIEGAHETLVSTSSVVQDVSSGDGRRIYAPVWRDSSRTDGKVSYVRDVTENYDYYTLFRFTISNPDPADLNLYLASGTGIMPLDRESSRDKALSNWTRVSIVEVSKVYYDQKRGDALRNGQTRVVFEKETGGNTDRFVSSTATHDSKLTLGSYADSDINHIYTESIVMPNKTMGLDHPQSLGVIKPSETRYYYGVAWLEGTEVENQDECDKGSVSISLAFAGIDPTIL